MTTGHVIMAVELVGTALLCGVRYGKGEKFTWRLALSVTWPIIAVRVIADAVLRLLTLPVLVLGRFIEGKDFDIAKVPARDPKRDVRVDPYGNLYELGRHSCGGELIPMTEIEQQALEVAAEIRKKPDAERTKRDEDIARIADVAIYYIRDERTRSSRAA